MKEFQEKRKFRKIIFSRFSLIVLLVILVILSISVARVYNKSRKAALKNQEITQKIEELESKKRELDERIAKLETGSGLEEEVREKFGVKKPGEEVLTIIDKTPENDKINNEESDKGFFGKIWSWIKDLF